MELKIIILNRIKKNSQSRKNIQINPNNITYLNQELYSFNIFNFLIDQSLNYLKSFLFSDFINQFYLEFF